MILFFESNGTMGHLPSWHRLVRVADRFNVPPWELMRTDIPGMGFWLMWGEWLLRAEAAGRAAERRRQAHKTQTTTTRNRIRPWRPGRH